MEAKVMLKILQQRLKPYMEQKLPDVHAGVRKERNIRDHNANLQLLLEHTKKSQARNQFVFYRLQQSF